MMTLAAVTSTPVSVFWDFPMMTLIEYANRIGRVLPIVNPMAGMGEEVIEADDASLRAIKGAYGL